ncbi:putative sucrose-phosphatase 2 [Zea mays]|uniref:Putative sucrose-phosphatase 2 n=1 Tax=Zea mays TaxID=4577 RepID=A0A1D6LFQ8_MAIZE|nr:putative sucrose-phosphatase 2 [Zea mays]
MRVVQLYFAWFSGDGSMVKDNAYVRSNFHFSFSFLESWKSRYSQGFHGGVVNLGVGQRLYLLRQTVLSHSNCPFAYLYHSVILSAIQLCTELSKASKDALEYATLCSIRIARKVPDLAENFMGLDASLLKEKHHGSLYLQFSYAQNYAKQAKML